MTSRQWFRPWSLSPHPSSRLGLFARKHAAEKLCASSFTSLSTRNGSSASHERPNQPHIKCPRLGPIAYRLRPPPVELSGQCRVRLVVWSFGPLSCFPSKAELFTKLSS
ncbi:uncharacterized protein BO95DRAFT_252214 [Aspergillus brunneoviolaceus CBS 621.78]|uniref:Uncharacterized protein n=1 Tax=Aspergillus brunneoviolaceus CBS 621.78 TaxID=1450534 RepID=A0ACD1FYA5_9EURO|nr:hypothetical protein BO95DRAFT_252214 [Aspergillus brunneoviolaceus CBS 621.78]RAH41948.1 hypothetical protein BO95DRAFT_252214 [Aspergillus brunneoviolaceus CBS 621.78]